MFHPLIIVFVIAFCAELIVGVNQLYFNIKGANYYTYIFACVGFLFFYSRFYFETEVLKRKYNVNRITLFFLAFCFINWLFLYKQENFFNFFRVGLLYASIILFFSVELFSRQVFKYNKMPLKNPLLLIGIAGIIFHAFYIFLVSIMLLKTKDGNFINQVFDIQKVINVFCYIFYTISILCIPKTGRYIK